MKTLNNSVSFDEVLGCFERENKGSKSFDWTKRQLEKMKAETGNGWTLVVLSRPETLGILLPHHVHPRGNPIALIPKEGLPLSAATERVSEVTHETGPCWENIVSHRVRDFSQVHVFLKSEGGVLKNLDGLHRLLAWSLFGKTEEVAAYVATQRH